MPEKKTLKRAENAKRQGKAPTTQAGEFVREEMEHVKQGKHDVKSDEQAIAIGLSKARRAGVKVGPPKKKGATRSTKPANKEPAKGTSTTTGTRTKKASATKRARKTTSSRQTSRTRAGPGPSRTRSTGKSRQTKRGAVAKKRS